MDLFRTVKKANRVRWNIRMKSQAWKKWRKRNESIREKWWVQWWRWWWWWRTTEEKSGSGGVLLSAQIGREKHSFLYRQNVLSHPRGLRYFVSFLYYSHTQTYICTYMHTLYVRLCIFFLILYFVLRWGSRAKRALWCCCTPHRRN